jgi:cell wall-associated NlpC family hydrolase
MRIILFFLLVFSTVFSLKAQHPIGDKLEQMYYQGHYSIVYRKSSKFMQKEDIKHLLAPRYYFAISCLQRSNNTFWLRRNKEKVEQSFEILEKLKNDDIGKQFLIAHSYELFELENDLHNWLTDLKQSKLNNELSYYSSLMNKFFTGFDFSEFQETESSNLEWRDDVKGVSKVRSDLASYASNYIGVPYKWGGTSSEGFDCSGFTQHVLKSAGYSIPRTAGDQFLKATKINIENVQCGDLVFFKNDGKISHVGMILSRKGNELKMIHASSSKGISIVEINGSEYWKKRFFGCATYLR